MIRFMIFLIGLAFIAMGIIYIINLITGGLIERLINKKKDKDIKNNFENNRCRFIIESHDFRSAQPNAKCKWCGKTFADVKEEIRKYEKFKNS